MAAMAASVLRRAFCCSLRAALSPAFPSKLSALAAPPSCRLQAPFSPHHASSTRPTWHPWRELQGFARDPRPVRASEEIIRLRRRVAFYHVAARGRESALRLFRGGNSAMAQRAPYGSLSFRRSFGRETETVWGLILTNVAVFSAWQVVDTGFMRRNFTISYESVSSGRWHTLLTSAFSHREPYHLAANMIGLYYFGTEIARLFGANYLLGLYLVGGLGASLCHLAYVKYVNESQMKRRQYSLGGRQYLDIPALGASGAVNAIVLMQCLLFPTRIIYINFFIPLPAIAVGLGFILHDFYNVTNTNASIGHAAHLGGAFTGFLAWALVKLRRF